VPDGTALQLRVLEHQLHRLLALLLLLLAMKHPGVVLEGLP
jgi:hypothetical protein